MNLNFNDLDRLCLEAAIGKPLKRVESELGKSCKLVFDNLIVEFKVAKANKDSVVLMVFVEKT